MRKENEAIQGVVSIEGVVTGLGLKLERNGVRMGNELNHSYTNPRVFDAVEDVARMIKDSTQTTP